VFGDVLPKLISNKLYEGTIQHFPSKTPYLGDWTGTGICRMIEKETGGEVAMLKVENQE